MSTRASDLFAGGVGPFGGAPAPIRQAARYFWPHHLTPDKNATLSTTSGRYYVVPIYIPKPKTFAGSWCYNSGAGDNAETIKMAIYSESASGGPGTLAKDFGEVTLTAASAVRNFASSWSALAGWYYLELVANSALALYTMTCHVAYSGVGQFTINTLATQIGVTAPTISTAADYELPVGEYVAGTYANFPEATSLTPATTVFADTSGFPLMGLYT